MTKSVRVRFAPSPTGYLHVGGARTMLFNWLYARKMGGKMILRIEDTDTARSTRESETMILDDIRSLGLDYDEGPEPVGGPFPPYRQSERMKIYSEHVQQLLAAGKVYYCFCSDDLITQKREVAMKLGKPPHYDGTCARIPPEEAKAKLAKGEKAGLRFRAPQKSFVVDDHVRGRVEFKVGTVGDFFVTRTPTAEEESRAKEQGLPQGIGMPVYNFCCVLDDNLMGITQVIRAEEHLSNTARQLMIYEAFGWTPPEYAHTALVLGTDRQKLSKRSGDVSVHEYIENGYLPEALLNFLVLLGWWPKEGTKTKSGHPEIFSREEIIEAYGLDRFQKAPAVFDVTKLKWMNGHYIKMLPAAEIAKRARPFFEKAGSKLAERPVDWLVGVIEAIRGEVQLLSELPQAAELFFGSAPELEGEAKALLEDPVAVKVAVIFKSELLAVGEVISEGDVEALQKRVAEKSGAKGKSLFMTMRVMITGKTHGPELKKILPLLGRAAVLKRVEAIAKQAGLPS